MKKLKLFFALFAMLALGVGNAWGETVTFNPSNCTNWTSSQAEQTQTIDGITLHSTGAANNTQLRLYSGATHTFTSTVGNITSILFTCTANGTSNYGPGKMTGDGYVAGSGKTGEWTGNSAEVTLTGGQSRCTSIVVTYTPSSGGGETPDPTPDPDPDPDPTPGTGETWTLVTNASNLKAGDQIVIAATGSDYALGPQASNNRTAVAITKTGNNITWTTDVQIITLEAGNKANTFAFNTGSGYLYAASSSSNNLKTKTALDDNGSWAITITPEGVATIKAQGSYTRNWIRKNSSSAIFSCYSSGQSDVAIYKKVTSSGETPETPTPSVYVAPASHTFATTNVGETATQEFTITAENTTATLSASIDNTTDFAISAITGDKVTVTYQPQSAGDHTATMTVKAGEEASTTVALTGKAKTPLAPIAGGVIDILNQAWTGKTNSTYGDVAEKTAENTGHSNAKYVAQCAGDKSSIQLRSNNSNSGVVSTISGGVVKRIEVEWHADTDAARTLQIYGSNTAYTAATDLYGDAKGELLGELNKGEGETTLDFSEWTGDYKYIGFRSKSGAMYLTTITITWLPINSKVTIDGAIQNGSVSVSGAADLNSVTAGTVLTLSNTPTTDYKLSAYDVYKTDDAITKVTVADGKFTMPEFDVTISATFVPAKTLTSIEITTPATQTTFWQGETFNHTGLEVTAHFDGAADEVVTPTVTGSTATTGTQTVTVSFTEGSVTKTTTYEITVKATANTEATAYDVTTAREIIDKVSTANDIYVQGIVSEIVTAYNATYGNITYNISADGLTTSAQLQAFRGKSFNGDNFTSADDVKVGDEVVVFGNLLKYNETYELAADNKLISLNRNKAAAGLAFETTEYTANVNEAFTAPTLTNPNGLTVTYSTSDATLATVDAATGAVTILNKTGKVTITASFAGNEDYVAATASYNITISDPSLLEATFVAATDLGNTTRGEGSIAKSPITFACSDGILGNGSEYRIYASAKATFSAAEGYIITKIVLTSTASGTADNGPAHLDEEDGTYTYEEKVGTWVGEAYIVTLSASKQVRAKTITVYYKQDNRTDAGLAWNPTNVNLTIGDAFTAPAFSNPNNVTGIEFTSSNETLATVSNAGAITLKDGVAGKATITALFKGNENYKPAEVTCNITVDHKSEDVVILAKCKDQYYALVAEYVETKNDILAALPVTYINGKIYNVYTDEEKASITWKRVVVDGKTTFKNGDNYLSAVNSAALKLETTECEWVFEDNMYKIDGADRTIIYSATNGGFKNYALSNVSNDGISGQYSSLAQTVAPVFANQDAYHRCTTADKFGTICLPFGSTNYTGATFYEFVGSETGKVYLGSVTTLEAGVPYIFLASATEVAVYGDGTTAATPGRKNGLVGTFTNDTEVAVGNYILKENAICEVVATCWVNAYRAYIVMEDVPGEFTKMPGRRYIGMSVQGENVETGVEDIITTDTPVKTIVNGQLIIIRDGVKYNVQGQKL